MTTNSPRTPAASSVTPGRRVRPTVDSSTSAADIVEPSSCFPLEDDAQVASDPGTQTLRAKLIKFVVVGGTSAIIDVSLLVLLREVAGVAIPVATTIAFWTALLYNFTLNRKWSFGADQVGAPFARYLVVVGLNYLVTLAIVTGGVSLGVPYILAKLFAIGFGTLGTFLAYDRWVFV